MDTYGLINLSELDKMIEHHKLIVLSRDDGDISIMIHASRLAALIEIKGICAKLPDAEDVFNAGAEPNIIFEEYIEQHLKTIV